MENKPIEENLIILSEQDAIADQPREKIPWVTVGVLACLCLFSVVTGLTYWYNAYLRPVETAPVNLEIAENPSQNNSEYAGYSAFDDFDGSSNGGNEAENGAENEPEIYIPRPVIDPPPEFVALREQHGNNDIVGILRIADTETLVVQTDNNYFYRTHNIYREECNHGGHHFVDHQADLLWGVDHNTVIHATIALRETLQAFMSYEFFLQYPTIELATVYGIFDWEIFSFYVAPVNFPFLVVNHPSDDIWGDTVEQFTLASFYDTRLDVTPYDQIITITVPTNISPDLFYVLQARMYRQITS